MDISEWISLNGYLWMDILNGYSEWISLNGYLWMGRNRKISSFNNILSFAIRVQIFLFLFMYKIRVFWHLFRTNLAKDIKKRLNIYFIEIETAFSAYTEKIYIQMQWFENSYHLFICIRLHYTPDQTLLYHHITYAETIWRECRSFLSLSPNCHRNLTLSPVGLKCQEWIMRFYEYNTFYSDIFVIQHIVHVAIYIAFIYIK